jgi:hypothetical protein
LLSTGQFKVVKRRCLFLFKVGRFVHGTPPKHPLFAHGERGCLAQLVGGKSCFRKKPFSHHLPQGE